MSLCQKVKIMAVSYLRLRSKEMRQRESKWPLLKKEMVDRMGSSRVMKRIECKPGIRRKVNEQMVTKRGRARIDVQIVIKR